MTKAEREAKKTYKNDLIKQGIDKEMMHDILVATNNSTSKIRAWGCWQGHHNANY